MTKKDTIVIWKTKLLAKEFDMPRPSVGRLLRSIGAKRVNNNRSCGLWYWDIEEEYPNS